MSKVLSGRYSAEVPEEGVVVFLIGMRITAWWRPDRWVPVFAAMPRMIAELRRDPCLGLLAPPRTFVSGRTVMMLQYWRDFASLEAYARGGERAHLPAWRRFNRVTAHNGAVGIFHETYRVGPGSAETLYANMPTFGLAGATGAVRVSRVGQSAAQRLGVRDVEDSPVAPC